MLFLILSLYHLAIAYSKGVVSHKIIIKVVNFAAYLSGPKGQEGRKEAKAMCFGGEDLFALQDRDTNGKNDTSYLDPVTAYCACGPR